MAPSNTTKGTKATKAKVILTSGQVATLLRPVREDLARAVLAVREAAAVLGNVLNHALDLYVNDPRTEATADGLAPFYKWAEGETGMAYSTLRRYMLAGKVESSLPKALQGKVRSADGLAVLGKVPVADRAKVLKDAGTRPTEAAIRTAVESYAKANPKATKGKGKAKAKDHTKAVAAFARKVRDDVARLVPLCLTDPYNALALMADIALSKGTKADRAIMAEAIRSLRPAVVADPGEGKAKAARAVRVRVTAETKAAHDAAEAEAARLAAEADIAADREAEADTK